VLSLSKYWRRHHEQLDVEAGPVFLFIATSVRNMLAATVKPSLPRRFPGHHRRWHGCCGLLVWVLISKYLDHLPLYRLEQIAARDRLFWPVPPWQNG